MPDFLLASPFAFEPDFSLAFRCISFVPPFCSPFRLVFHHIVHPTVRPPSYQFLCCLYAPFFITFHPTCLPTFRLHFLPCFFPTFSSDLYLLFFATFVPTRILFIRQVFCPILYQVFLLSFPSFCATISLTFFYYKHDFFVSDFIFALCNFFLFMFSHFIFDTNAISSMEIISLMALWGCTLDWCLLGEHGVDRNIFVLQIEKQPPFLDYVT